MDFYGELLHLVRNDKRGMHGYEVRLCFHYDEKCFCVVEHGVPGKSEAFLCKNESFEEVWNYYCWYLRLMRMRVPNETQKRKIIKSYKELFNAD